MKRKILFITMALLLLSIASWGFAASVNPKHIPGADNLDKTCAVVIPGSLELKIEPVPDGTYSASDGVLSVNVVKPSTEIGASLNSFDWAADIPVLGVVVKNGTDGANFYNYGEDGSMGDMNLETPFGGAKGISHISFCYIPFTPKGELKVTKTAVGTYDRVIKWDLEKSVDNDKHSGFVGGEAGSSIWTVIATKSETLSSFKVSGDIEITNESNMEVTFTVSDVLDDETVGAVTCPKYTLAKGESVTCTYEAFPEDAIALQNVAKVTVVTTIPPGYESHFMVAEATADIAWTGNVTGDDAVTLKDERFSYEEIISVTTAKTFEEDFKCSDQPKDYPDGVDQDTYTNTATLTGKLTDLIKDANVEVICYAPLLKKNAQGSYDEVHEWDVEKTVDPTKQSAFIGDTVDFDWIVTVTKTVKDENISVSGTIYVKNPAPMPMTVSILDYLNGNDTAPATILPGEKCDYADGSLTIPAESMAECKYLAEPDDYKAELNTVMATINSVVFTATADVAWTTNVINPEVTVDDDLYSEFPETISEGDVWTYSGRYTCSTNLNDYIDGKDLDNKVENTAVIKSGDVLLDESTATAVIDCYAPVVKKTAETSLERTWNWKISKVGKDPLLGGQLQTLTLSVGQVYEVLYGVTVGAISADSGWGINGKITVANPADKSMTVKLSDSLDDGTSVTIDFCETPAAEFVLIDGMLTVPAGMTATCYYSASPEDDSATLNTATATLNDIDFTATAIVDFSQATVSETDECIDVTDDQYGDLGKVCASEGTKTLTYKLVVGPYEVCGQYEFVNVASFVTNNTGATGSDSWTIVIDVPCGGCTLTIGYWKTHSMYGPAPYDETWALLGEDTPFFLSGKTYYEVLWTPPAGNAYYILAPQYVAAELNMLNGASVPSEVQAAFDEATALFETYTPADIAKLKGKAGNELRAKFIALANILDKYNNGEMGVPYCSE